MQIRIVHCWMLHGWHLQLINCIWERSFASSIYFSAMTTMNSKQSNCGFDSADIFLALCGLVISSILPNGILVLGDWVMRQYSTPWESWSLFCMVYWIKILVRINCMALYCLCPCASASLLSYTLSRCPTLERSSTATRHHCPMLSCLFSLQSYVSTTWFKSIFINVIIKNMPFPSYPLIMNEHSLSMMKLMYKKGKTPMARIWKKNNKFSFLFSSDSTWY